MSAGHWNGYSATSTSMVRNQKSRIWTLLTLRRVPPNCQFEIEDAEDDWTFQENSFDYIHGRDFYHSIRDWRRLVQQAYE
jgi:Methyltransferase domain